MEHLIDFYLINMCINLFICLCIYFSLELYNNWNRNRADFWVILLLGSAICFVPFLNLVVIIWIIYLYVIIPIVELLTPYKYSYSDSKFKRKSN